MDTQISSSELSKTIENALDTGPMLRHSLPELFEGQPGCLGYVTVGRGRLGGPVPGGQHSHSQVHAMLVQLIQNNGKLVVNFTTQTRTLTHVKSLKK